MLILNAFICRPRVTWHLRSTAGQQHGSVAYVCDTAIYTQGDQIKKWLLLSVPGAPTHILLSVEGKYLWYSMSICMLNQLIKRAMHIDTIVE